MPKYAPGKHPESLKNLRPNIPQIHEEAKTVRLNTHLTPTGKRGVMELAEKYNLSLSELIERIGRGEFEIVRKIEQQTS